MGENSTSKYGSYPNRPTNYYTSFLVILGKQIQDIGLLNLTNVAGVGDPSRGLDLFNQLNLDLRTDMGLEDG
jgi:hypothetical protein